MRCHMPSRKDNRPVFFCPLPGGMGGAELTFRLIQSTFLVTRFPMRFSMTWSPVSWFDVEWHNQNESFEIFLWVIFFTNRLKRLVFMVFRERLLAQGQVVLR